MNDEKSIWYWLVHLVMLLDLCALALCETIALESNIPIPDLATFFLWGTTPRFAWPACDHLRKKQEEGA